MMDIGKKIRQLRLRLGLTQEELAARTELSKGFISQMERNLTSPSIATLMDILEALGTDVASFFAADGVNEKIVFTPGDMFENEDDELGIKICWLVPNAQKNELEPIMVTINAGGSTVPDDPHDGEEFGYVMNGKIRVHFGEAVYTVKAGESFYYRTTQVHRIEHPSAKPAKFLWISTPPEF